MTNTATPEHNSVSVTYCDEVALVFVPTQPDGSWDVSEVFEREWDAMARELYRAGFSHLGDEPTKTMGLSGGGECEVYVCEPCLV